MVILFTRATNFNVKLKHLYETKYTSGTFQWLKEALAFAKFHQEKGKKYLAMGHDLCVSITLIVSKGDSGINVGLFIRLYTVYQNRWRSFLEIFCPWITNSTNDFIADWTSQSFASFTTAVLSCLEYKPWIELRVFHQNCMRENM